MAETFPVFKLGILVIKQLSRPIANVIKDKAKENQYFRQYVAMPPAYFYNWVNVKVRMWSLNLGKPTNIPQLNETMAIELGSTLLGEIILFAVPATILVFEYIRQSRKEARKQEEILIEKLELVNTINNLEIHVERQDVQLKRIKKTLEDLAPKRWSHNNTMNDQFDGSPLHLKRLPLPEH
ncbi:putative OPA3-like protein CG13603 [Bradysia coprophila]|uniref:putative OPA3-like protein CG13603 n=1 Tax=Bradysia coprophila TaxID=38358 RepID=UPI00187DB1F0|nr:putative OPA3-like protein CG13603 [Bradysia coprophila]